MQEVDDEPWSRGKLAAHIAALAVSLAVLAAGAVAASRFTSAYWVQVRPFRSLSRCFRVSQGHGLCMARLAHI